MPRLVSPARLLPLGAGLALGLVVAWLLKPPLPLAPLPPASPLLQAPPCLPPTEAPAAIAAWLALLQPAADSVPADFATQTSSLHALLTLLPDDQLPRLLEALLLGQDPAAPARPRLRQIALETWLDRDPAAAAHWATDALRPIPPALRLPLATQATLAWARLDPDSAYAWALQLPELPLARSLTRALLTHLAATDAPRALALAEAQDPEFLAAIREDIFQIWAKTDPAAALRTLGRDLLDTSPGSPAIAPALGAWMTQDLPASLAWLAQEGPPLPHRRHPLLRQALEHAARGPASPAPLADALALQPDDSERSIALLGLLIGWIAHDPPSALAWLDHRPATPERTALIEAILADFWPPDSEPRTDRTPDYLTLALALPAGPLRDTHLATLISAWARQDPASATAWLEQQQARDPTLGTFTPHLESGTLAALALTDPATALARFDALPPGPARDQAAPEIAFAWAQTDPAAATRWLAARLPPIPSKAMPRLRDLAQQALRSSPPDAPGDPLCRPAQILAHVVYQWMESDPLAALRWAESQPDPGPREIALTALALRGRPDPVPRADLLALLHDPATRADYLSRHLRKWLKSDLTAAREWLQTHDVLPRASVARLLADATPAAP